MKKAAVLPHDMTDPHDIRRIVDFEEDEPYDILGPHLLKAEKAVVIRAFLPRAAEAWIRTDGPKQAEKKMMDRVHPDGFFQAVFENTEKIFPYQIGFREESGHLEEREDPYAFPTIVTDYDLYLLGEGNYFKSYEKFGARAMTINGVPGMHFAVWAPNAKSVSVTGDFNHWKKNAHPMARVHFSGVWGLFIPRLGQGEVYKFCIKSGVDHSIRMKADPYAVQSEKRPRTASVTADLGKHQWNDREWMEARAHLNPLEAPAAIYEVHLGSWRRGNGEFLNYRDLAHQMVDYVKSMGYTHIELLPVMEHPLDQSWGYQVINYYAPSSRFGSPEDFMVFVDHCHQNGIGVILDWTPAHFPKDSHGLADFDGRQIYAYQNWKKAEHPEWGTLVFDYGRNEVKNFLISNALFWLEKYHIDGLRVDAVASMLYLDYSRKPGEWEPNAFGGNENLEAVEFLKKFNSVVHAQFPGALTIAEESTAWPGVSRPVHLGGLGFTMKWNMGWMHDTLEYFSKDPLYRKYHQGLLTFSLLYAFSENFVLPVSHDEVVYGKRSLIEKMPGDIWQKFANARLFLGYMFGHPGKKLLFMTHDVGQYREWNSEQSMDWHLLREEKNAQFNRFTRDLLQCYRGYPAFYEQDFRPQGFDWVDFSDADSSVISFLRWTRSRKQALLFVYNMTPVPRHDYRTGVPFPGFYREILNSDAWDYGGSGMGNFGGRTAENLPWHGKPYSVSLNLPPLSVLILSVEA